MGTGSSWYTFSLSTPLKTYVWYETSTEEPESMTSSESTQVGLPALTDWLHHCIAEIEAMDEAADENPTA